MALLSPFQAFYAVAAAGTYFCWANFNLYEPSRRMVVRMDILPHLEMVSVMRLGFNGKVYNKVYRIAALEKVSQEDLLQNEVLISKANRGVFDLSLVFRDQDTGDFLYFDQNALWSKAGLEHSLLN